MIIDFFVLFNNPHLLPVWILFFIICITLDIIIIIHIIINKHSEPTSAILWIFIVVDFHLLGILVYLILGINRVKSKWLSVDKHTKSMRASRIFKGPLSAFLHELTKFQLSSKSGSMPEYQYILDRIVPKSIPVTGNKVDLLIDGTYAYPRMCQEIKKAKHHVNLQSYIINNDVVACKIFSLLEEKAKEGVKVKVLFDALGSSKAYKAHFFKHWSVKHPNFKIIPFSRLNLLTPYRIQMRNHRKLLVCDGKVAFIGGINISSENDINLTLKNRHIHDLHCRIEGPAVGDLQYTFLKDWSLASKTPPLELLSKTNYFPIPKHCGDASIRVITSGPGQSDLASKKLFMTAATSAQKSLWIMTPYFVPDSAFLQTLCMASARNVDIRVIIPQNNNHWYVRYACRSLYSLLLRYNIRIFEKTGNFSHVKAMIIDGQWAAMGSSNCDVRSFKLNYELDCIIEGSKFISDLHNQFQQELSNSVEIDWTSRKKRSFNERLLEDFCSLFTPVL